MNDDNNRSALSIILSAYVPQHSSKLQEVRVDRPSIRPNERLAVPHPSSVKRAALLVDRIYLPCWNPAGTAENFEDVPLELTFGDPKIDQQTYDQTWIYAETDAMPFEEDRLLEIYLRNPLLRYRNEFPQANIIPVNYEIGTPLLPLGEQHAYHGVFNNIPVVIEEKLTWLEVVEFRKDPEARRKYRDLHLWLASLKIDSEQQATDLIAQKLDDYRWSIKKHGLATSIETISSLVSLSAIVPPMGGLAADAMQLDPVLGAIAGGSLAVTGATAWVAKRLLNLEDIKRGKNREIAYLYDIQSLAK